MATELNAACSVGLCIIYDRLGPLGLGLIRQV